MKSVAKRTLKYKFIAALVCAFATSAYAETSYFCGADNPKQAAQIETLIPTLYDIVSGRPEEAKDWHLLKQLFSPKAMITPVFHNGKDVIAQPGSVGQFIALNKRLFKDKGFFEREVSQKVFKFGHMANVLSVYESRRSPELAPYARGVNSFQLLNDGRRWCVLSVTWDSESEQHPLTEQILHLSD
ncbi:hypothetical protein [Pseudoalteromonas rubra]|uniref:hypothetical protein n=1 Tax=Pseudoalteromonas rubra TaxID=43658 RepID=UPI000F7BB17B|nr:hypothetical protein [Pseudoalteromonas rubra]